MSFNVALSGLSAAQRDLDVTSNNIANVNTTGFKESRAEFADVYAGSLFSAGKTKSGDGVTTTQVSQQFHQGSLQFTNNSLDLAVAGEGFFAVTPSLQERDMTYTRAGAFQLNNENFITDANGNYLQGYQVDPLTGDVASVSLSTTTPIRIPDSAGAPRSTSSVNLSMNLDSREAGPNGVPFDPADPSSYNHQTSVTVYDSLGESHILTSYFRRDPTPAGGTPPNSWDAFYALDGNVLNGGMPYDDALQFSTGGVLTNAPASSVLTQADLSAVLSNGAQFDSDVTLAFQDPTGVRTPTQFASSFELSSMEQDGTTVGRLTGIDIDSGGKVVASYSNGDATYLGQIALVNFSNNQGLLQVGDSSWKASLASGEPLAGEADSGVFGAIKASALEQSNVNLTNELVDLISAQRNFQANSRALEVSNSLQQNILQIR